MIINWFSFLDFIYLNSVTFNHFLYVRCLIFFAILYCNQVSNCKFEALKIQHFQFLIAFFVYFCKIMILVLLVVLVISKVVDEMTNSPSANKRQWTVIKVSCENGI